MTALHRGAQVCVLVQIYKSLQLAAEEAARSGDLRTWIEYAGGARHTIQRWDELRT